MRAIRNIREHYTETKAGPETLDTYTYTERAIVNAVTIITGQSWEDTVRSLIEQVHFRCEMPSYSACISDLLRANGFIPVSYAGMLKRFLLELDYSRDNKKYIVKTDRGYLAVVKDSAASRYVFKGPYEKEKFFRGIYDDMFIWDVWFYVPGTDNRSGDRKNVKPKKNADGHQRLKVQNVNPDNRNIGDCAVRALAGAYGCSWYAAVDYIAEMTGYSDPTLNAAANIKKTLLSLGFEEHEAIKQGRRLLTGKQFCEMMDKTYFGGERIYAFIGKSHCVAVVPHAGEDAQIHYVFQDTWDSTERKINEYYVYKEKDFSELFNDNESGLFSYEVGATIKHPEYGIGKIVDIRNNDMDRTLFVEFENLGIKLLSEKMLIKIIFGTA